MPTLRNLAERFEAYGDWRVRLTRSIEALREWLEERDLGDARAQACLERAAARLQDDKLVVAFVAEFSRGKSELINAIFFGDLGQRLLPSSAGRTTMCPTELLHDPALPPSLRLLPIETREREASVTAFKAYADEWTTLPLDLASASQMTEALARVREMRQVPVAVARGYGLHDQAEAGGTPLADDATVEVPAWRHAIINLPHPLLQQGLVILDTPGLNAIGAEPELTLSLLPTAHAVLFLLGADTGVTRSDLEVWHRHLGGADPHQRGGRLVVLNKIDGLWDELKSPLEIDDEIARQVDATAAMLDVPSAQVYGVSAHKALVAKINGDDALLARSGLPALEEALSQHLIPAKREIVGAAVRAELEALADGVRAILAARRSGLAEQMAELGALRGKNQDFVEHMMERVLAEKALFERGLARFTAVRNAMTAQSNALFDHLGIDALRAHAASTREAIEASPFTRGVRTAMSDFFTSIRGDFASAASQSGKMHGLISATYARFAEEFALPGFSPPVFSVLKYEKEIDRLERAYNLNFNTLWNMVSRAKFSLMKRFFETIASRVRHVYEVANRDLEAWVKTVMSPLETHVREQHQQLRRRLDSIRRIHRASGELEGRIAELEASGAAWAKDLAALDREMAAIAAVIDRGATLPAAANA